MNKMMMIAAACAVAVTITGCKSIEVERYGQKAVTWTDTNGVVHVVCDAHGNAVILDGGWYTDYFQHWNWQRFDALNATAGTGVALSINNYESGADSNLVALVHTSLDGLTKLVVACGDAYVKIAGAGAQADTALTSAAKIVNYFRDKGGDVNKATVTTDEAAKTVTVTDGTTAIKCDAAGNCTECTGDACKEP